MSEHKRIIWLIIIMACVGIFGGGGTFVLVASVTPGSVTTQFIVAGILVISGAVVVNVMGGVVFYRITSPLIKNLQVSEKRFHSITDTATDAIIAINSEGNIVSWNDGATEMFGYHEDQILGGSLLRLIPERHMKAHKKGISKALKAGEIRNEGQTFELAALRKDGQEFPMELTLGSWVADGETYFTGIIRDITLRKQMEAQIIQSEKMAAIGTMTAGIGHEINNPLYAIYGLAEAIRDSKDQEKTRAHSEQIIEYSKNISEVVKNLSGFVRPAQNHELELVDINETITKAIAMVHLQIDSKAMKINKELAPLPAIPAKSEEIQQIFFNVIRNGIQAMGEKGVLNINSHRENGCILVRIEDSGSGIAETDLQKIFDPFFTTKGPDEGEGLGLFVVHKIVNKYSGAINYDSQIGKGTVCTIQFPVNVQHNQT